MEFVSELFERLEEEERPFPKRMKLAQNAYFATGGSSGRILTWICSRLKSISEEDFEEFRLEWMKLVTSVHNQHVRPLVKLMLEVVNDRLRDYERCMKEDIFNHVVTILEITRVQNYFFSDLNNYISFLSNLLSVLSSGSDCDPNLSKRLLETVEAFARTISLREFPVLFLDKLLFPIVHLVNKFQPHSQALERNLLSCIEMAIFYRNTSLLAAYLDSLIKTKKKKSEERQKPVSDANIKSQAAFKPVAKLLEIFCQATNSVDKYDIMVVYTAIFNCLARTNNASVLSYKMLIVICPLIGFNVNNAKLKVDLPDDIKESCKSSPDETSFEILESILSVIFKENIPLPDEGELQTVNWIECLWRTILSVPLGVRQSGAYLQCLTTLLQLHPRVVMNRKLPIITDVLVILTPEKEIPEFVTFLRTLMSIHQKRFSVHELLTNVFTSSKQLLNTRKRMNTSTLSADKIVPPAVYGDIQKFAADWTSNPVLEFLDFMITQLQTLAFTSESQRSIHTDCSTSVGVRVLCAVLSGARVVDHCGNEKIRLAYVDKLNRLSQVQKQMATVCQTSQNLVFVQSFLDMEYTWTATALMLYHYCPEASRDLKDFAQPTKDENIKEESFSESIKALSFVHAHISRADWETIQTNISSLGDLKTRQLLVRLEVQSLRYFLVSCSKSRSQISKLAKDVLPRLVSSFDIEIMLNDVCCVGSYLTGDELKLLIDKLVEILLSSGDEEVHQVYTKNFLRLQENKAIICGIAFNLMERLGAVCSSSEDSWQTTHKILHKIISHGIDSSIQVGEKSEELLLSLGKALNKAIKKSGVKSEVHILAESSSVKQILNVLNVAPLEYFPENLQTAVMIVMFGLSFDLLSSEESEEKSSLIDLIYHQLIFGMLERWHITTEAPPLEKYVNIAQIISHVKDVTGLQSDVDINIVHSLLGLSLRSSTSLNKVVGLFFSNDEIPEDDYLVQQEMLSLVCKDFLTPESRENLKSTDCESRVLSVLSNFIQQQSPKKQFLPIYTLLLNRALKKKQNLNELVPNFAKYCKLSLKSLRNPKQKRAKGEDFIREILNYHEFHNHFPQNYLVDVWNILLEVDEPGVDIASLLFAAASKDDFEPMVQRLMKELECTGDTSISRTNVLVMWEALIKSHLISEPCLEKRLNAISFFLSQQHIFLTYPATHLLKVVLSIVESSKIVVLVYTADHILQAVSAIMNRGNRSDNIALAPTWFAVLDCLLFHRSSQTLDCLPAFTAELRLLLQHVVVCSRQNDHLDVCISIAQGIEKMFQTIVKAKLTRNFIRIGAYILADMLKYFEGQLPQEMKAILENIACEVLGFLDTHAQRFLGKVMTAESNGILKEIGRIRTLRRSKIV